MELYLLSHGLALPPSEDSQQPLNRDGILQIKAVARVMKSLGIGIDTLVCSGEKRSRQSAALIAEGINYPYSDIVESPLVAPAATCEDLETLLTQLLERPSVLIAGHRPSLARLNGVLLGAGEDCLLIESGAFGHWTVTGLRPLQVRLRSWLTPEQLRLFAGGGGRG
ncbi:MAG: SixA phosphatase family protein [Trichloromonadaceae bacterium]